MTDRPRTRRELLAMLPRDTWVGANFEMVPQLTAAQERVDAARSELEAAELALTEVVTGSWMAGASWRAIGAVLGVSRQSAWERFGAAARRASQADDEPDGDSGSESDGNGEDTDPPTS